MIRALFLFAALALSAAPALAHKVIMGIFPSGSQIEGEIAFSGGEAPAGQLVEVFDPSGIKLGETTTDADGFFLFTPSQPVGHLFRADLGAGHVAQAGMTAEEVAAIVAHGDAGAPADDATIRWNGSAPASPATQVAPEAAGPAPGAIMPAAALSATELDAIAKVVRDEIRPLRREISAYKEKNDLQTVLGGLGYIAGLFGLGFYIAARRKLGERA